MKYFLFIFLAVSPFLLFSQAEDTFRVEKKSVLKAGEKEGKKFHRTFFISSVSFLLDTSIAVGDTIRMQGAQFPLGKCSFTISDQGEIFKAEMLQGVITPALFYMLSEKLFKNPTAICFADIQEVKTTKGVVVSAGGQYVVRLLY